VGAQRAGKLEDVCQKSSVAIYNASTSVGRPVRGCRRLLWRSTPRFIFHTFVIVRRLSCRRRLLPCQSTRKQGDRNKFENKLLHSVQVGCNRLTAGRRSRSS